MLKLLCITYNELSMHVELFCFVSHKECLAYQAAQGCQQALKELGYETCLQLSYEVSWQDLLRPSAARWSLSFGQAPSSFLKLQKQPHLHWHLDPLSLEFPWECPHLWLGSPFEITHARHLFLPHATDAKILPRLPVKFPIVLFENLTEDSALAPFLNLLGPLPVHVFGQHSGANWLRRLSHSPLRFLHPPLPFSEHQRVLQQSQLLILPQQLPMRTSHPWVLPALAAGCLVLSAPTPYMKQFFQGYEFLLLGHEEKDSSSYIQALLGNSNHLVQQLQRQLLPRESWQNRLQTILPNFHD
ncbi:MAG: hypothetical protein JSS62_06175 [Verrucomicrobia bacterium]|nr:hypothetical protein [Verrucomicrobiota bacterium]